MSDKSVSRASINIEQLRFALDNVPAYVYIKDSRSRYLYANKLTLKLFGCDEEELINQCDSDFFSDETVERLRGIDLKVLAGGHTEEEVVIVDKDGSKSYYWEVKTPIYSESDNQTVEGILGISTDITERKHLELQLTEAASTDFLTGLDNRKSFFEKLTHVILKSDRNRLYGGVVFIDLDDFKLVNDSYGHAAGDEYLVLVAERIKEHVRGYDVVARFGGDEFVVLLDELTTDIATSMQIVDQFIQKIKKEASKPYKLSGISYRGSVSCGFSVFLGKESEVSQILAEADVAMYKDKKQKPSLRA